MSKYGTEIAIKVKIILNNRNAIYKYTNYTRIVMLQESIKEKLLYCLY